MSTLFNTVEKPAETQISNRPASSLDRSPKTPDQEGMSSNPTGTDFDTLTESGRPVGSGLLQYVYKTTDTVHNESTRLSDTTPFHEYS
jgi:hypothetical protein